VTGVINPISVIASETKQSLYRRSTVGRWPRTVAEVVDLGLPRVLLWAGVSDPGYSAAGRLFGAP